MAEVAAQDMSTPTLASPPLLSAALAVPQPQPQPQVIRDDEVKDTWELGLGYAVVGFRSTPFNATMSGPEHDSQLLPARPFRRGRSITSAFGSQSFQQRGRKIPLLWRGSEAEHGKAQTGALRARTAGRGPHVFRKRRRATMDLRFNSALAWREKCRGSGSGCELKATTYVRNCMGRDKQFSSCRRGELPVLVSSWFSAF